MTGGPWIGLPQHDGTCRLWFFEHGLPGYSWYVPKAGGHLNVGVGGIAAKLKAKGDAIRAALAGAAGEARQAGLGPGSDLGRRRLHLLPARPPRCRPPRRAYLAGDAAGLATTDLAEGIGPAVQSGLAVAEAIATGTDPSFAHIGRKSLPPMLADHGGLACMLARRMGWA